MAKTKESVINQTKLPQGTQPPPKGQPAEEPEQEEWPNFLIIFISAETMISLDNFAFAARIYQICNKGMVFGFKTVINNALQNLNMSKIMHFCRKSPPLRIQASLGAFSRSVSSSLKFHTPNNKFQLSPTLVDHLFIYT